MRSLKLLIIGIMVFMAGGLQAQIAVNVRVGVPPPWGPVGFNEVHYYYLPDVEAYYDVPSSMFIYNEGGVWVHRANLPGRYRNYDLYGGYKVVMKDYRGNAPYNDFKEHKQKWGRGYRGEAQRTIGERPGKGRHGDNDRDRGKGRNVGHDNDRGDSHGKDKNRKEDHGPGAEKGRKK